MKIGTLVWRRIFATLALHGFLIAAIDEGVSIQVALGRVVRAMGVKEFAAKVGLAARRLMSKRHLAAAAAICAATSGLSGSQQDAVQAAQFRAAVSLTRVDVTVLDKRTRQVVRGLTADDFIVRLSGQTQEIHTFVEVEHDKVHRAGNPEATSDVAANVSNVERLFVIVMDDSYSNQRIDPFYGAEGRRIAHTIVDGLGPGDRAALIFSQDNRHAVDFTADRAVLREAIDTYTIRSLHPRLALAMSLGTLQRAREALLALPGYRRIVAWISPGPEVNLTRRTDEENLSLLKHSIASDDSAAYALNRFQKIVGQSALSAVPVYAFRTAGLLAPSAKEVQQGRMDGTDTNVFMDSVAAQSGGDAYVETNTPHKDVSRMFAELSAYYALGLAGVPSRPGASQHLSIEVRRPGLEVVPSSLRFRQTSPGELSDRAPASGLLDAFASPLATGSLPLRMATLPVRLSNQRDQALIVTLGLNAPIGDEPARTYTVRTAVFDGEGRREVLQQELSVTVSSGTEPEFELVQHLKLRPGRYNVRTYVQRSGTTEVGSVFAQATVPDFAREPLSMSGIAVGRAGARAVAGREMVADLLPFAPTAQRTFFPTDKVGALWRVYATSGDAPTVTQTVQILDSRGTAILTEELTHPASAFSGDAALAGVEQRFELPLSSLPAGNYVLRVVASSGPTRALRDVRFDVDHVRAPLP